MGNRGASVMIPFVPNPSRSCQAELEKGEVLLRGVGILRYDFPPNASVQWQPGDLTIHTKKSFPGAGFLGAPPISLTEAARDSAGASSGSDALRTLCPSSLTRPLGKGGGVQ